jgi:hypothetical protein
VFGSSEPDEGAIQGIGSFGTGIGIAGGDAVIAGTFAAQLLIDPTLLQAVGPGDIFAARRPL